MNCEISEERMVFFHLGELGEAPRAEMEAHLGECAECLASYWRLKRGYEQSQRATAGPAPAALLREKIRAVVLPLPQRRAAWAPLAGWGALAAAVLVIVLGAALRWPVSRPAPPPPGAHTRLDDVDSSRPEPATLHFL